MPLIPPSWIPAGLAARFRSLWTALRRRDEIEADMAEEFRHHIELRTEHLIREGLPPKEARRRAHLEFGHPESLREDARASRGLRFVDEIRFSSLDVKLGVRMFLKHAGLSFVAVFGMAVAMAIGIISFEILSNVLNRSLPVPEGEQIVSVGYWNTETSLPERHLLHDYLDWSEDLGSIRPLAAFREEARNLILGDAPGEPVPVAEITPSGFRALGVPPVLGRALLPDDAAEGAAEVVVIGYDTWQKRFGGSRQVLGKVVQFGRTRHTVVGVMPEGFEFPLNHQFWVPLRLNASDYARGDGPGLYVFGRLAGDLGIEQARTELEAVGSRTAAAYPETHGRLRPRIVPYTRDLFDLETPGSAWFLRFGQLIVSLLLVVVCVNVAVLIYARTVARRSEIAMRTALGASRRRVVAQLFAEALVLASLAGAIGLAVSQGVLVRIEAAVESMERVPYWIDLGLSRGTLLYALLLTLVAATIVGVLPALRATGKGLQRSLRALSGGGGTGLGKTWSVLIVSQVAMAMFVLPMATLFAWETRPRFSEPGFPLEEILTAEVDVDVGDAAGDRESRRASTLPGELIRALEAEPGVMAVTVSSRYPGIGPEGDVEVQSGPAGPAVPEDTDALYLRVAPGFFATYGADLLAGRTFDRRDLDGPATQVVVNRAFVDKFLGGNAAVGQRIRYTRVQRNLPPPEPEEAWYEIVGVVSDFPGHPPSGLGDLTATIYHPLDPAAVERARISVRVAGGPAASFAHTVRTVATRVDPTLQVDEVKPLEAVYREERFSVLLISRGFAMMTLSVLLLSGAGIFALMSFAVAQRTREIGIRAALGAGPRRILAGIFGRVIRQLGAGAAVGLVLGGGLIASSGLETAQTTILLVASPLILLLTGFLAALGPARRGLAIQPSEALRNE